jgi:hypothetical protein
MFDGVGIVACDKFVASEPLVCHVCTCCTTQLTDFLVRQSTWAAQKATDRYVFAVLFTSDNVINANGLVQVKRFNLIDEHSVLIFSGRIVRIVPGVPNDLRHWPHGDQISSTFVITPQTLS